MASKQIGNFNFIETSIKDVYIIEPKMYGDSRGYFMETYKKSDFFANGITVEFNQDNHSKSTKGVLRGLHFQKAPHAGGRGGASLLAFLPYARKRRAAERRHSVDDLVHFGGVGFFGAVAHVGDAHAQRLFAEGDFDDVADLDVVGRLDDLAVYADMRRVAGVVCHGAPLDEARDL